MKEAVLLSFRHKTCSVLYKVEGKIKLRKEAEGILECSTDNGFVSTGTEKL